jgi:hypothetical protein
MSIDDFIEIVAPKLKMQVRPSYETMKGSTHKLYKIPAPVVVQVNHKAKLRLAWLRGGRQAVKTYLGRYLKAGDVSKVMERLS